LGCVHCFEPGPTSALAIGIVTPKTIPQKAAARILRLLNFFTVDTSFPPQMAAVLVVTAAARRGRWLVTRAAVVAPGPTSGVGWRERHRDTEDDAGKRARDELALAEPAHDAHLPPRSAPEPLPGAVTRKLDALSLSPVARADT
jgi:hypothetical protein